MSEYVSHKHSSSLPEVGIDPVLVEKFFSDTLGREGFKKIPPEALRTLKEERYVPATGKLCDLELLEALVRFSGRIRAEEPGAVRALYRKYGDPGKLQKTFAQQIGLMDPVLLAGLKDVVRECAQVSSGRVVEDSLNVLDDLGPAGEIRAYAWPFIGVQVPIVTTVTPKGAASLIKERLADNGFKPWRVGEVELSPGAQTQRGATVCVFIGR